MHALSCLTKQNMTARYVVLAMSCLTKQCMPARYVVLVLSCLTKQCISTKFVVLAKSCLTKQYVPAVRGKVRHAGNVMPVRVDTDIPPLHV